MSRGVKKSVNLVEFDFNSVTPIEGIQLYETPSLTTGEIYMVTCLKNNKKYIGKSNSYVTKKNIRQGTHGRFVRHLRDSTSEKSKNDIPLLYEDMRKYGSDNFKTETLYICDKNDLKKAEEYFTNLYKSSNDIFGYNLNVGNKKPNDEKHLQNYNKNKQNSNINRAKNGAMKQSEESKKLPPNISIFKRKGTPVGYKVELKRDGKLKSKTFSSVENTMEQNLQLAINQRKIFLKELNEYESDEEKSESSDKESKPIKQEFSNNEESKLIEEESKSNDEESKISDTESNNLLQNMSNLSLNDNNSNIAKEKLPQGISLRKNKKQDKYIGYLVNITRNGIKKAKTVTNMGSMEENLKEAIKIRDKFIEDFEKDQENKQEVIEVDKTQYENQELPKYILLYKNRQKEIKGYRVDINHNTQRYHKLFANKNLSMKENYDKAIEFKDKTLKELNIN